MYYHDFEQSWNFFKIKMFYQKKTFRNIYLHLRETAKRRLSNGTNSYFPSIRKLTIFIQKRVKSQMNNLIVHLF